MPDLITENLDNKYDCDSIIVRKHYNIKFQIALDITYRPCYYT